MKEYNIEEFEFSQRLVVYTDPGIGLTTNWHSIFHSQYHQQIFITGIISSFNIWLTVNPRWVGGVFKRHDLSKNSLAVNMVAESNAMLQYKWNYWLKCFNSLFQLPIFLG